MTPPETCVPPAPGRDIPFSFGEKIEYVADALGAKIGSFSMNVEPGHRPDTYTIVARGKTDSVAADFYPVEGVAESRLGRALEDHGFDEDDAENGMHRSVSVTLPVQGRVLPVRATREGNKADFNLSAPAETVDMLAALYQLRSIALPPGTSFCFPVFGAHRIWILQGSVAGRETVSTPDGDYKSIHLSGTAVRTDAPQAPPREVHIWLSDDDRRIPVMAMGAVQNKPVRVVLTRYVPGIRRKHG
jgi:hypothetical protein